MGGVTDTEHAARIGQAQSLECSGVGRGEGFPQELDRRAVSVRPAVRVIARLDRHARWLGRDDVGVTHKNGQRAHREEAFDGLACVVRQVRRREHDQGLGVMDLIDGAQTHLRDDPGRVRVGDQRTSLGRMARGRQGLGHEVDAIDHLRARHRETAPCVAGCAVLRVGAGVIAQDDKGLARPPQRLERAPCAGNGGLAEVQDPPGVQDESVVAVQQRREAGDLDGVGRRRAGRESCLRAPVQ